MGETAIAAVRAFTAATLVAAAARGAWHVARRLCPGDDDAARVAGALAVFGLALTVGFNVLVAVGAFGAWGCVTVLATIAAPGLRAMSAPTPRAAWSWWLRGTAAAVITPLAWRWLRASVSPAIAPDSVTYHLYRAARWVQLGHDAVESWPDYVGYCEFVPYGAEVFWGYGFALTGSDLAVASVGTAVWVGAGLAAWSFARAFGAGPDRSALAAMAVAAMPCVVTVSSSGYVDAWTLATFLTAAALARRALEGSDANTLALAAAATGLHLQSKLSALPAAAVFFVTCAAVARGDPAGRPERLRRFVLGCAVALLAAGPGALRSALATGSPLYPLPFGPLHPGSRVFVDVHRGRYAAHAPNLGAWSMLRAYVLGPPRLEGDPVGWGPAALVAAPLALVSVVRRRATRAARAFEIAVLAAATAGIVAMAAPEMREMRGTFLPYSQRLLVVFPATLLLLGARVGGPRWDLAWVALALVHAAMAVAPRTSPAVVRAALDALPRVAAAAVATAVLWRVLRGRARVVAAGTAGALTVMAIAPVRARHREAILDAMGGPPHARSLEVNPVGGAMRLFWRAGDALARDCARVTAVAHGWSPPGDKAFRYPLMGSRWENRLVYVPVTRDGAVVDLADESTLAARVDPARWYARLVAAGVDHVVVTPPYPRELGWMLSNPALFESFGDEALPIGLFRVRAAHRCPR